MQVFLAALAASSATAISSVQPLEGTPDCVTPPLAISRYGGEFWIQAVYLGKGYIPGLTDRKAYNSLTVQNFVDPRNGVQTSIRIDGSIVEGKPGDTETVEQPLAIFDRLIVGSIDDATDEFTLYDNQLSKNGHGEALLWPDQFTPDENNGGSALFDAFNNVGFNEYANFSQFYQTLSVTINKVCTPDKNTELVLSVEYDSSMSLYLNNVEDFADLVNSNRAS